MKLGFVTAILPELPLEEVVTFAELAGYASVEVMCWPPGRAERRYAGVTHVDVTALDHEEAARIRDLMALHRVEISSLGYYPNPLAPDPAEAEVAVAHLRRVIDASSLLGIGLVTTFVGRDPSRSVDANWPRFLETWRPLIRHAEDRGVRVAIENCPMLFTADEWPGGKNLATSPAIWERMFSDIPSPAFGLNYDPSHMVWQGMDPAESIRPFADRLFHVHAKDARIDRAALARHGVLAFPNLWHTPKLPGLGDVDWAAFVAVLGDLRYDGHVAVEVEDRSFEGSTARRKDALVLSQRFLCQHVI
jgi:sugar phosphate isomerase/epimerase